MVKQRLTNSSWFCHCPSLPSLIQSVPETELEWSFLSVSGIRSRLSSKLSSVSIFYSE
jgi:hypothetical protein